MEAIALLSGVKLLIDIFEDNWTGVATGILLGGSDLFTTGDSLYYMFDLDGNLLGEKDIKGIKNISLDKIRLENEREVKIGLQKIERNISLKRGSNKIGFTKK